MSRINEITTKQTDFTQSVKLAGVNNEGTPVDVYLRLDELYAVLAYEGRTSSFEFGGQAHGGFYDKTFTASATFNANDGNNQRMVCTGDTTLALSNELPGTYIIDLPISGGGVSSITIGASLGTAYDDNAELSYTDGSINTITLFINANGDKRYTITSIVT